MTAKVYRGEKVLEFKTAFLVPQWQIQNSFTVSMEPPFDPIIYMMLSMCCLEVYIYSHLFTVLDLPLFLE